MHGTGLFDRRQGQISDFTCLASPQINITPFFVLQIWISSEGIAIWSEITQIDSITSEHYSSMLSFSTLPHGANIERTRTAASMQSYLTDLLRIENPCWSKLINSWTNELDSKLQIQINFIHFLRRCSANGEQSVIWRWWIRRLKIGISTIIPWRKPFHNLGYAKAWQKKAVRDAIPRFAMAKDTLIYWLMVSQ